MTTTAPVGKKKVHTGLEPKWGSWNELKCLLLFFDILSLRRDETNQNQVFTLISWGQAHIRDMMTTDRKNQSGKSRSVNDLTCLTRSGLTVVCGWSMLTGSGFWALWGISRTFSAMKLCTLLRASTVPCIRQTLSVVPMREGQRTGVLTCSAWTDLRSFPPAHLKLYIETFSWWSGTFFKFDKYSTFSNLLHNQLWFSCKTEHCLVCKLRGVVGVGCDDRIPYQCCNTYSNVTFGACSCLAALID